MTNLGAEISFVNGTLVVPALPPEHAHPDLVRDERTGVWRAPAHCYRAILLDWHRRKLPYQDNARKFEAYPLQHQVDLQPYPHQRAALAAWVRLGGRGVAVMPTGAGKTLLAIMAMVHTQRPTLVVVPTIDLLQQWHSVLHKHLGVPIGMLGGGAHQREAVTVATYDSAAMQTEFLGNRFGLLICDECHHLPAPSYRFIAAGSVAPYRLGLTATYDRVDGGEALGNQLLGPVCHTVSIEELAGRYLAPYEVHRVEVALSPDEAQRYSQARALYLQFLRDECIRLAEPTGWAQFVMRSAISEEGRLAMRCYREQRRIAFTSQAKIAALWQVLLRHRADRILIFTSDNETVYRLSELLLLPSITHRTKPAERQLLLQAFTTGELPVLLTSRVLNEGVDVPAANVGVVLSGSGSVREHVQRLGRILRKQAGKRAFLYEICTAETAETNVSERRRQHAAYGAPC